MHDAAMLGLLAVSGVYLLLDVFRNSLGFLLNLTGGLMSLF